MPINGLFGNKSNNRRLNSSITFSNREGGSYACIRIALLGMIGFTSTSIMVQAQEALTGQNATSQVIQSDPAALPLESSAALLAPLTHAVTATELLVLVLFSAILLFAIGAGAAFISERRRNRDNLRAAHEAITTIQSRLDQSESLLNALDQLMIIWNGAQRDPDFRGNLGSNAHLFPQGMSILAFGNWLHPECAQDVEFAIEQLRMTGQRFILTVESLDNALVEISGRTSGARAIVQLRMLDGAEYDRARLDHEAARQASELARLKHLLDALPMPIWSRDEDGHLSWMNDAYLKAIEADNLDQALRNQTELLDQRGREAVQHAHGDGSNLDSITHRMPVIVAGKRQIFEVTDVTAHTGTVGIAIDVSQVEATEKALERTQAFHTSTMDQLTTPVAIFDSNQNLHYYNAAYSQQFKLDPVFLDGNPSESAVLDRMRVNRSLPEQADFHGWKLDFLSSYRNVDPTEHWWHLPDGQSLRVVATPNPDGGVTYLFDNVTEQLELEKRYNSLIRIQQETLDHLNDGVVVFGSGGRLRVSNPAFAKAWNFPTDRLEETPHIAAVLEWCRHKCNDEAAWNELKRSIVGLEDKRMSVQGQLECNDGTFLDYASIPLPDGATMVTFVDVTDSVTAERNLQERNEALLAADQLKNTFVQHVSYELRSPLNSISGFTELLQGEAFGTLNEKQREYVDHIMTSSSSLRAIVNDILDLATIDAGIMQLELEQIDPVESIRAAAEGLQDRLAEKDIHLDISVAENMGQFVGDEKRVRQVLFNLISNAIAVSEDHGEISVHADRLSDSITFAIRDHGCGIPEDYKDTVFDRFESRNTAGNRRGVGLGLSIVKSFVELHGGSIQVDSREGGGTIVSCSFPIDPQLTRVDETAAAE